MTCLKHRHEQLRYVGLARVEKHEVWHPPTVARRTPGANRPDRLPNSRLDSQFACCISLGGGKPLPPPPERTLVTSAEEATTMTIDMRAKKILGHQRNIQ